MVLNASRSLQQDHLSRRVENVEDRNGIIFDGEGLLNLDLIYLSS